MDWQFVLLAGSVWALGSWIVWDLVSPLFRDDDDVEVER